MASPSDHEPSGAHQSKKAAASGWIGSALEYYDFFIYATAASLVFPQIFFPSENPTVAIVASLATYGVGYVARPIGAFVLGHLGDTHGRKTVLLVCMFIMGFSTMAVGLLPTYSQVGLLAPALLVVLRLIQGFAVAGEISGASSMILEHAPFGRRGFFASFSLQGVQAGQILAAAVFLPLAAYMPDQTFNSWGWRIPFLASVVVIIAGYIIRREVAETPAFAEEDVQGRVPKAPIVQAFTECWPDMLRVVCMSLMNVIPVGRHDFRRGLRGPAGLRNRLPEGHVPVDPGCRQHPGGDHHSVCRRPVGQDRPQASHHRRRDRFRPALVRLSLCDQHEEHPARDRDVAADVGRGLPGV
jgi:MFS family permease